MPMLGVQAARAACGECQWVQQKLRVPEEDYAVCRCRASAAHGAELAEARA